MEIKFLEDYILLLGGLVVDPTGTKISYLVSDHSFSLATYDRSPVANFITYLDKQICFQKNEGLTDRQVTLAKKIVSKYRKQFKSCKVFLPEDIELVPLRFPIRTIDRSNKVWLDENKKYIKFKFAYNNGIIESIYKYKRDTAHTMSSMFRSAAWDKNEKVWTFLFNESSLMFIIKLCEEFSDTKIDICKELEPYILEAMSITSSCLPTVDIENNSFVFKNCSDSLITFFNKEEKLDLSNLSNIVKIIELRKEYGYELGRNLVNMFNIAYGDEIGSKLIKCIESSIIILPCEESLTPVHYECINNLFEIYSDKYWVIPSLAINIDRFTKIPVNRDYLPKVTENSILITNSYQTSRNLEYYSTFFKTIIFNNFGSENTFEV